MLSAGSRRLVLQAPTKGAFDLRCVRRGGTGRGTMTPSYRSVAVAPINRGAAKHRHAPEIQPTVWHCKSLLRIQRVESLPSRFIAMSWEIV